MFLRNFVNALSENDLHQVIKDFREFEADGQIGDCLLRTLTQDYINQILGQSNNVGFWMRQLYTACLERFYDKKVLDK